MDWGFSYKINNRGEECIHCYVYNVKFKSL